MGIFESMSIKRNELTDWQNDIPEHIAIMMDGNGRWAKKRGLSRSAGHYAGLQNMKKIIGIAHSTKQIRYLTFYAFSTENWTRPKEEVEYLIDYLPNAFFKEKTLDELMEKNIKIQFIGDISKLPHRSIQIMEKSQDLTKGNDSMTVNIAMNYGGRSEIVRAIKRIISEGNIEEITEEMIEKNLYTSGIPSPNLIIRTSGEKRLSNFLLWQAEKSELWFTDTFFPDFDKSLLFQAILDYQKRKVAL
jgi:undecaprenyl diphosphate synthase